MPMKASRMAADVCTYDCGRGCRRQAVDALVLDRVVSGHAEREAPSVVHGVPEPGRASVLATLIARVVITANEPEICWLV
jgi:hypothetical protein